MLLVSSLGSKDFSGQPLIFLFYEVEKRVDKYMGVQEIVVYDSEMRPQCLNTYTLYLKYNLIIEITVNLDESFNAIRVCILREISLLYFNPMKLISIPQFTKDLISTLEKKNIAKDFRKKLVFPKGVMEKRKGLMDHKGQSVFKERYKAKCSSRAEEKRMQAELKSMAQNLADSPFLEIESQYITDNPEMRKAIQKGGKQICESCMSVNCRLKQLISIQLELNELQTNLGCEGSPKLTFADIRTKEAGAAGPAVPTAPPQS